MHVMHVNHNDHVVTYAEVSKWLHKTCLVTLQISRLYHLLIASYKTIWVGCGERETIYDGD